MSNEKNSNWAYENQTFLYSLKWAIWILHSSQSDERAKIWFIEFFKDQYSGKMISKNSKEVFFSCTWHRSAITSLDTKFTHLGKNEEAIWFFFKFEKEIWIIYFRRVADEESVENMISCVKVV